MNTFDMASNSYKGREYLYLFPRYNKSVDGGVVTYYAVNYHAINSELNSLLALFSISGERTGVSKLSEDNKHSEVWFEVDRDFYDMAMHSNTFRTAIERLGVKIATDYPFTRNPDWADNLSAATKTAPSYSYYNPSRLYDEDYEDDDYDDDDDDEWFD
jgi:hypothetical protein